MTISFQAVESQYARLLDTMSIPADKAPVIDKIARRLLNAGKARYALVEKTTGVPLAVVMAIHYREADGCFNCWLHNGDPMYDHAGRSIQTTHEPPHRPPNPAVTWNDGAADALAIDGLSKVPRDEWTLERVCYELEKYNGEGYRDRGFPDPYLWSWSNNYRRGKFVKDHEFDEYVVDTQLGTMPLIARAMMIDVSISIPRAMMVVA